MNGQTIIAGIIVTGCVLFLARRLILFLTGKGESGCPACASSVNAFRPKGHVEKR